MRLFDLTRKSFQSKKISSPSTLHLPISILFASALASPMALADESQFTSKSVTSLHAENFFARLPDAVIPLGTQLKLAIKDPELAHKQFPKGFQVRVFRLNENETKPKFLEEFDPCLVFLGVVTQFTSSDKLSEINLGSIEGLDWLTLQKGEKPKNGLYLLVAESLNRNTNLVRIEKKSIPNYFLNAIYFEVKPPHDNIPQKTIDDELEKSRKYWDAVKAAAKKNDSSLDCLSVAKENQLDIMAISDCSNDNGASEEEFQINI